MYLELDVIKVLVGVTVRCSFTSVHIVYYLQYVLALLLDLSCIPELNKTWNAYFIPDLMLILKMIFFLLLWLEVGQGIVIYLSQNDFINISKSPTHSWDFGLIRKILIRQIFMFNN